MSNAESVIYAILVKTDKNSEHGIRVCSMSGKTMEQAVLSLYYDAKINNSEVLFDSVYGWNDDVITRLNTLDFAQIGIKRKVTADFFDCVRGAGYKLWDTFMASFNYDDWHQSWDLFDEIFSASEFETIKFVENQFNTITQHIEEADARVQEQLDAQRDEISNNNAYLQSQLYSRVSSYEYFKGRGNATVMAGPSVNCQISEVHTFYNNGFTRVLGPFVAAVTLNTAMNGTICSFDKMYYYYNTGGSSRLNMKLNIPSIPSNSTVSDFILKYIGQPEVIATDLYTGNQVTLRVRPWYSLNNKKYYDGDSPHGFYSNYNCYAGYDLVLADLTEFELRDNNPDKLLLDVPIMNITLGYMSMERRPVDPGE